MSPLRLRLGGPAHQFDLLAGLLDLLVLAPPGWDSDRVAEVSDLLLVQLDVLLRHEDAVVVVAEDLHGHLIIAPCCWWRSACCFFWS
eukprot:476804-Alexandrium_andersonii.AAC.1